MTEIKCFICGTTDNKLNQLQTTMDDCNHVYCVNCILHTIFIHNIKDISSNREIMVKCKCNRGKKILQLSDVQTLLKIKSDIEQNQDFKNIHEVCKTHNANLEFFCKDCDKYICLHCTYAQAHQDHKLLSIENYAKKYRDFIKSVPIEFKSLEEFLVNFNNSTDKFKKQLDDNIKLTVNNIDELISNLSIIKIEFLKKIKETFENGIESMQIMKMFYFNFYNDFAKVDNMTNIFTLRYLALINCEYDNLEMTYNQSIFNRLEEIKKQTELFKSSTESAFSVKLNYKDIPKTFREIRRLFGHKETINCLIKIGDSQLVSGSKDQSIKFWDLNKIESEPYNSIDEFVGPISTLLLLKDDRLCSSTMDNSYIKIWEKIKITNNDNEIDYKYCCSQTLSGHKKSITGMTQLDNKNLISVSKDQNIIIWTPNNLSFKIIQTIEGHNDSIYAICKINDEKFITGGADNAIKVWSKKEKNGKYINTQTMTKHKSEVRCVISLSNGNIFSGSNDGTIKVWIEKNGLYECSFSTVGHHNSVTCLAECSNGQLISGSKDKTIRIWEPYSKGYIKKEVLRKHNNIVSSIIVLDGGYVASAGGDGVIIIWKNGYMTD